MRRWLLWTLALASLALAACAPRPGPTATCFTLLAGDLPCEFRPLPEPGEAAGA